MSAPTPTRSKMVEAVETAILLGGRREDVARRAIAAVLDNLRKPLAQALGSSTGLPDQQAWSIAEAAISAARRSIFGGE